MSKIRFKTSSAKCLRPLYPRLSVYCISAVCCPILFKICMKVAYRPTLIKCYMAFTIKGQRKDAAAFKGSFAIYGLILFKLCMLVAYWPPLMICYMAFTIKAKQRPQQHFWRLRTDFVQTLRAGSLLASVDDLLLKGCMAFKGNVGCPYGKLSGASGGGPVGPGGASKNGYD